MAAPKEKLLEKSPGQFRYAVCGEGCEQGDARRHTIGDCRKRAQQNLVEEQKNRRMDNVNAIRNAADVPEESEPHESSQERFAPGKHEQQRESEKQRQPGISDRLRERLQWIRVPSPEPGYSIKKNCERSV